MSERLPADRDDAPYREITRSEQWRTIATHNEHGRVSLFGDSMYSEETMAMAYDSHIALGSDPVIQRRTVKVTVEYGEWEDVPREALSASNTPEEP